MIRLLILAVVFVVAFMFAKQLFRAIWHFFDFIFSWFIKPKKCSCGETTICLKCDDGKYRCVCQKCFKSTEEYDWACSAKNAWNGGGR